MRKGHDRSQRGIPNGTRHLCPFCEWYLDMEPISLEVNDRTIRFQFLDVMDALNRRLEFIERTIRNHMITDHPKEYAEAEILAGRETR